MKTSLALSLAVCSILALASHSALADVTAVITSGDLVVEHQWNGSTVPDSITITPSGNQLRIRGNRGTLVNGASEDTVNLPTDDLVITLTGPGDNQAFVSGVLNLPDDIRMTVSGRATVARTVLNGSHADIVVNCAKTTIWITASRDLRLNGGDHWVNQSACRRNFYMTGNGGWDKLLVTDLTVEKRVELSMGSGNDDVRIEGLNGGNLPGLKAHLGNNTDWITFKDCQIAWLDLNGGGGSDTSYMKTGNNFLVNSSNTTSVEYKK